ncbi:pyridoxal phosphate-dependent transferase [Aspergillus crustosus]
MVSIKENNLPVQQIPVSSSWCSAGPAAYDFRTDTITTPTLSMLQAIAQTTLMDDKFTAALTGKEDSLLVMSGTMGNQIALRSLLTQPPHASLCHERSHILQSEAGGCSSLSQAHMQSCAPLANGQYLTLEDIKRVADTRENIHIAPTRVISLENTLAGVVTPLEEVRRISLFARATGIKMYLDGARIWEAVAAGAGSLTDYLECFDTAQMCFSKGLGAPIGEWVRKSIGGGIRQAGVIAAAAARVAVEEKFGKGLNGEGGRLREGHARAKLIEKMWLGRGGRVSRPVETWRIAGSRPMRRSGLPGRNIKLSGGRIVVHYQIVEEAVDQLEKVFDRLLLSKKDNGV